MRVVDSPRMDPIFSGLVLAGLMDGAALYAGILTRRARQRRIDARIAASAHLYGLVRVALADRRLAI
jgi:hypothetical protein